jgi:5-methyltetrahydropteroyltriglutamate--homocysteine methyltransferase
MKLPTTTLGSFPKPEYLRDARRKLSRGAMAAEALRPLEEQATRECIRMQEELGLDVLVDGEMYRGDMTTYFAQHLEGFGISGLVRSYGNRYYRKPILRGSVKRPRPITVDWWRFAQSLTAKPVKAILTGPYTMMDWSFHEHGASREAATMALAGVLHQEIADLEAAGAQVIQIDEPAISVRPDELHLAISAMRVVTKRISARTIVHICYGDLSAIYPKMLDLAVDQFALELSNSDYDVLEPFARTPFTKEIGFGVLDVHSHLVETVPQLVERLHRALEVFPSDKIWVNPDCGLKTRTEAEARAKLEAMVEAARIVRREIGE